MGTFIALPMLDCMTPLLAAEPTAAPRRSAFIYLANGVHSLNYQITKPGKDYEFSRSLKPLELFRQQITPISGLHHPMVIGKHHNCEKVWLTGANVPGDGGPFRNTVSADQLIAEVQGATTRFSSLEMAIEGTSLAWSRDGAEKIYVQDRMRQVGRDLWAWIAEGAHIYVCGDAKRMAKDVEIALVDIIAQHGARSSEEAAAFVSNLKKVGRYQQDVY